MLNSYAEHRESKLGSVPNSSHPLKGTGLLGVLLVNDNRKGGRAADRVLQDDNNA
jgi:hypothetical protein